MTIGISASAFGWADDFDAAVRETVCKEPMNLAWVAAHPAFRQSVPTPEHFLPLAYFAGLCGVAGQPPEVLVEGGALGSLTMTSFVLGCEKMKRFSPGTAEQVPYPSELPPEQTNM